MDKTVVLIDDDSTTNLLNKMIIDRSGLVDNVVTFDKAQDALVYFKEIAGKTEDNILLLLDVNMPIMNGWDFLEEYCPNISSVFKNKDKVIMLTSSIDPADKEKAKSFPCVDDFVSKPLSPDLLSKLINQYLV